MLSICVSVSRRKADNLRQSSQEATAQTRLNQHEPFPGISGQMFSSLRAPETACPTWSQQMTAQLPGKLHLHFGQLPKCRWVVWYTVTRTPAHHWPWPAFLPVAISRRKADNLRQSSQETTAQTRLNQHEPFPGISGQMFSSLRAPETACPTWSQQMTAQLPGNLDLHFGQLPKCRWVVWHTVRRTPAHHCPSPAFLPDAIYLHFRQP